MFDGINEEWLNIIIPDEIKEIEQTIDSITTEDLLCPPKHQWFEFARLTPLDNIKVILLGQDPYYTPGTAHGLAFSSLDKKIPPSLNSIYKCLLSHGLIKEIPNHANLTEWAQRGVLLINSALSTEQKVAKRHSLVWARYIPGLLKRISAYGIKNNKTFKFLLFGNDAKAYKTFAKGHDILEWIHPSPMAQRNTPLERQFISCPHFGECDIDWSITNILKIEKTKATEKEEKKDYISPDKIEVGDDILQVFTDGSCNKNGKIDAIGGFSAIFVGGPIKGKKLRGKISTNATSQRAEGKAIITVLERALVTEGWTKLQIYTDSDFWQKMLLEYMPKWNEQKFSSMKNPDITKRMWALWEQIDYLDPPRTKEVIWVPAHNKLGWSKSENPYERWCYENNHAADKLAEKARSA